MKHSTHTMFKRLALSSLALCALSAASVSAFAQASSVRAPTAVRLMPAGLSAADVQTMVTGTVGSGIPVGFVERRVGLSAGPVSADAFAAAWSIAGWPRHSCTIENGVGTCPDGRSATSVMNEACSGSYASVVYDVVSYNKTCTVDESEERCTITDRKEGQYTCAKPVTYVSYLVKDTSSGAGLTITTLTAAQLMGYRFGADGVRSDADSRTAVCQGLGYRGAYSWRDSQFATCGNNRVSRFVGGSWRIEGACGGLPIGDLTCAK